MNIAERIKTLRAQEEENWNNHAAIRQEIRTLQKQCPHQKEDGSGSFIPTKYKMVLACSICGFPKVV